MRKRKMIPALLGILALLLGGLVALAGPASAAEYQSPSCRSGGTLITGLILSSSNSSEDATFLQAGWSTDPNAKLNRIEFRYWNRFTGWHPFAWRGGSSTTYNDVPSSGEVSIQVSHANATWVQMRVWGGRDTTEANKKDSCVSEILTPGA